MTSSLHQHRDVHCGFRIQFHYPPRGSPKTTSTPLPSSVSILSSPLSSSSFPPFHQSAFCLRMSSASPVPPAAEDEPAANTIDADKLSYEIFSILESKFLFGLDDPLPKLSPSPLPHLRGKVRLLCIDGGGMRGLLPARALSYLEHSLKTTSGDPHATISDYFDLAAGTGVGGLFAAMLFATRDGARPLFTAADTSRFLADHARRFLRKPSSSSAPSSFFSCVSRSDTSSPATAALEKVMKDTFGPDLSLRDTVKPLLIPCYDLATAAPFVFSRADALESSSFDFRLWEVCRATWAEPGRFEPALVRSIDGTNSCVGVDGGLAMSNPAAAAITHVLHNKQEFPFVRGVEDLLVLSLGCGGGNAEPSDLHKLRRSSAREWARPVARIASDGAADLVDHAVALAFGQCRSSNYVRIQANGCGGADADCDPSASNVKVLLAAADEMLKQKNVESVLFGGKRIGEQTNAEKMDWFAGELVLEHQRRSGRIAPTVAFKQLTPKHNS